MAKYICYSVEDFLNFFLVLWIFCSKVWDGRGEIGLSFPSGGRQRQDGRHKNTSTGFNIVKLHGGSS